MPIKVPYVIIVLLSIAVILTLGVCLLTISVSKVREARHYLTARRTLAIAYLILAATGVLALIEQPDSSNHEFIQVITLIAASFQALLFTFSLIVLIDSRYVFSRRSLFQLIPVCLISLISICGYCSRSGELFYTFFHIAVGCYMLQLIYYIWFFDKAYRSYQKELDNFFSGDEEKRIRWIRKAFYSALGIGILAIAYIYSDSWIVHILFIILYTLFYAYFAVNYINYYHSYQYFYPVVETTLQSLPTDERIEVDPDREAVKNNEVHANFDALTAILEMWIERKGFVRSGVTLEQLTVELKTNRSYLSRYINAQEGLSFRQWIRNLRIEEAKRLLEKHPDKPITHIGEMVGIDNKSSFYRQFQEVTGFTPGEFREKLVKECRDAKSCVSG